MGALDLSVEVRNISPKATKEDLLTFFSYCGTVDEIWLQRDGDQSQLAVVTFRQPFAYQTALLLNDAIVLDQHVRILPLENGIVPIVYCTKENIKTEGIGGFFIPATQSMVEAAALRGQEALHKVNIRLSEIGKTLSHQANTVISSTEQTLGSIGSAVSTKCCFSKGTLWLSNALDRASKNVVVLGGAKASNPNSRKQK